MNKKKLLCCVALLLNVTLGESGKIKGNLSMLKMWSEELIDFVRDVDGEVMEIADDLKGKKGLISVCAAVADAVGRIEVHPELDIPQNIMDGWSTAADAVLHG